MTRSTEGHAGQDDVPARRLCNRLVAGVPPLPPYSVKKRLVFHRFTETPIPLPQKSDSQPDATAKRFDVDWGTASVPRSKFWRFCSSLLRRYRQSTLRLLALEILCLPRRIRAIVNDPILRYGNTFQCGLWDDGIGNFQEERRYSHVCMGRIQELRASHPWVGPIDLDLALYMHRKGALWALHTYGKGTQSTQQIQPSANNTSATRKDAANPSADGLEDSTLEQSLRAKYAETFRHVQGAFRDMCATLRALLEVRSRLSETYRAQNPIPPLLSWDSRKPKEQTDDTPSIPEPPL